MTWRLPATVRPASIAAFGASGERTAQDLAEDAARVAAELPDPVDGSHVLLVFKEDRYAFAASLLGAWARGHAVALPPNTRRESVWTIRDREDCVALVHDTDAGSPIRIETLLAAPAPARIESATIHPDRPVATVFSSGSTGVMTPLPKTAGQLLGEASVLIDRFGVGPDARVAATVPPGHIYGLLFGVLVPLVAGASFMREAPLHAESVAERVIADRADVLVTVPAHLRGFAVVEAGRLQTLTRVFSSTAPLAEETAAAFLRRHGLPITEVLGSSETGGIATRVRTESDAWTPLPRVDVAVADGRLLVSSPFVDQGVPQPVQTADLAELLPNGAFVHRGRVDGVVKVGGRRVSLPGMQRVLERADGVGDAAVVAVDTPGGRGTAILAALVAPGWDVERVRTLLADHFEASTLPRRVLFVDALPREDNGKLQRGRMLRLFGLDPAGRAIRWELDWLSDERSEDGDAAVHRFSVHVPPTYGWYEGHFPGYPILAGAVQLHELVQPAIRRARPDLGRIEKMARLKFLDRILPDDTIDIELSWRSEQAAVDFRLMRGQTTCSAGRLGFTA